MMQIAEIIINGHYADYQFRIVCVEPGEFGVASVFYRDSKTEAWNDTPHKLEEVNIHDMRNIMDALEIVLAE